MSQQIYERGAFLDKHQLCYYISHPAWLACYWQWAHWLCNFCLNRWTVAEDNYLCFVKIQQANEGRKEGRKEGMLQFGNSLYSARAVERTLLRGALVFGAASTETRCLDMIPPSPFTACLLKILHLDLLLVIGSFPSRSFAKTFKMYTCACSVASAFL